MPNEPTPEMRDLVDETETQINDLTAQLETGQIDNDTWLDEMQNILVVGHLVSWMLGQESENLEFDDFISVSGLIQFQLQFLDNFSIEILTSEEFMQGWYARAEMYASAMNQTYWQGHMKVWPLPAMPGQGTICLSNCRCEWREENVNLETNSGAFFWELDPNVEEDNHCQTCLQRNDDWYPVLVVNGELVT